MSHLEKRRKVFFLPVLPFSIFLLDFWLFTGNSVPKFFNHFLFLSFSTKIYITFSRSAVSTNTQLSPGLFLLLQGRRKALAWKYGKGERRRHRLPGRCVVAKFPPKTPFLIKTPIADKIDCFSQIKILFQPGM